MPYENGGRGDKSGNRFEIRWTVYQILEVIDEKLDFVMLEALGDDEQGVDIWIGYKNGVIEAQQCKGRNSSKDNWDYGSANAKGIFDNWKYQLERKNSIHVSLVSPIAFQLLEDLISRAKTTTTIPHDFYNNQVLNASKELNKFYRNFCKSMNLSHDDVGDQLNCVSILNRISYRQIPDTELKNILLSKINILFIGNEEDIYDSLMTWVIDGNILGKQITQSVIYQLLRDKNIQLRNLALDQRIKPRIDELNREYRTVFKPVSRKLIARKEFNMIREKISSGESIIIHGKAGRGKSGCTEDIINYCDDNVVPYIAIKLDKRIPSGNATKWGQELGLPTSIVHCIHNISKSENAVIILDQLDALRWTQVHSQVALLVCAQIIEQVERVNLEREKKISLVFVCRTYDFENDKNIRSLFKHDDKTNTNNKWDSLEINELDETTVKSVVGNRYEKLTGKLKEILRIPSNLYIWEHLDKTKDYLECSTTNHLVSEWWRQLERNCFELGLNETELNLTKEKIISYFDKSGRIFIPSNLLSVNRSILDFLSSNGFIVEQGNRISFTHQSILDCFLADMMLKCYYETENILDIIGDKKKQTTGRRYQVQMLLQNLLEFNSSDFLNAGQIMLSSEGIRYSVKFVFFELLNQLDDLDERIQSYIIENCEHETYGSHIVNNIIYSKPHYIKLLMNRGILDKWFKNPEKKETVIDLLISKSPNYDKEDIDFIEKYAFESDEIAARFARCFFHDINQDSDEMFELRMNFYSKYPQMAEHYLDFKSMLKKCEMRTIRMFAFLLENKLKRNARTFYKYVEEYLVEDSDFLIKNGTDVLKLLFPLLPPIHEKIPLNSDWSGRFYYKRGLERSCIQIIKKANSAIIASNPEKFWTLYKEYMGIGNELYNEIILDAMNKLPTSYSDAIIEYICSDFDSNIFEETSGNGDRLLMVKEVIAKHSKHCNTTIFDMLETTLISYISPVATKRYQRRINYNREKNGHRDFSSYWGDLQKEILEILPYNRLSKKSKELIKVLNHKFPNGTNLYKYSNGHSGYVNSPVEEKKLSNKSWIGILTNDKISKEHSSWEEGTNGFIESSIKTFAATFSKNVSEEPERMINLMLSCKKKILEPYIDSLFNAVAFSENLKTVSLKLLEAVILKSSYDYTSYRASSICSIIENSGKTGWSQVILDLLKDIAINHLNPELEKPNVSSDKDKKMRSFDTLQSNALNCVRGRAATAIAQLIWDNSEHFLQFKSTIEKLISDKNPAVKLASLFALWPSYNIERDWAAERILYLYEQDYRLAGFHGSKNMFFLLYPQYRERILGIIKKCYDSDDEILIKCGAHCLAEMFILKNEFVNEMTDIDSMSKLQAEEILYMVMLYFDTEKYNHLAKNIIREFKTSSLDLEMPVSRLFYDNLINLDRDKDFLIEIMNSDLSRRTLHAFVHYLEEEAKSVVDFKDVILSMSHHLIQNHSTKYNELWGVHDEISKLIIALYDETSGDTDPKLKCIAQECLDIWDLMFEKQIGPVRRLSYEMMER